MSQNGALDDLLDGAVEFFVARRALEGDYYDEEMRQGVRGISLATLAYLTTQASKAGFEDEMNALLFRISQGDGR